MIARRRILSGLAATSLAACEGTTGRILIDRARGVSPFAGFPGHYIDSDRVKNAMTALRPRPGTPSRPGPDAMDTNLNRHWLVEDARLVGQVRRVADRLLAQWPGNRPDAQIWILQTEEPVLDVSHAHDIFISLYWLNACPTEDALAFFIAHEFSHVILSHFDRESLFKGYEATLDIALQVAVLGASLATSRFNGQSVFGSVTQQGAGQFLLQALGGGAALSEVAETFLNPIWTRQQEFEADMLAVDLMARAGYSAAGVTQAIELLDAWAKQTDAARVRSADQMRSKIDADIARAAATQGISGALSAAFDGLVPMASAVFSDLRADLRALHPDIEARRENLFGYRNERYENAAFDLQPPRPATEFVATLKTPLVAPLLAIDRQLGDLKRARAPGAPILRAEQLVTQLERSPNRNLGPVRAATAGFRINQAPRRREARRQLNETLRSEVASLIAYEHAANGATADRDFVEAQRVLDLGQDRFGSDRWFVAPAIQVAQLRGDRQTATRLYESCVAKGSQPILKSCNEIYTAGPKRQAPGGSILDGLRQIMGG
jgi:Zn-dependent protease with chaperone function